MRGMIKTANRFDSIWTMFLMLPALFLIINTGISMYQGKAQPHDVVNAGGYAAEQLTSHYVPIVDGAGAIVNASVNKIVGLVSSCLPGKTSPVYLDMSMAGRGTCFLGNSFGAKKRSPTLYRSYR